jgi:hypothetical protein
VTWLFLSAAVLCLVLAAVLLRRISGLRSLRHLVGNDEQVTRGLDRRKRSGVVASVSSTTDTTKVVKRRR